jgi:hypothetical protein
MPSTSSTTAPAAARTRNQENEEVNARVQGHLDADTRGRFEGPRNAVRKLRDRLATSPNPDITITEALDDIGRSLDVAMGTDPKPVEEEDGEKDKK